MNPEERRFVVGPGGGAEEIRSRKALKRARNEKAKKMKKAKSEREDRRMVPYNPNVTGSVRRSVKRAKGVTGTVLPRDKVIMVAGKKRIWSVVSGPNGLETIQKRPRLETMMRSIGKILMSPVRSVGRTPGRMLKRAKVIEARKRTNRIRSAVKKNAEAALAARSARPVILQKLINNLGKEVSLVSSLYTIEKNKPSGDPRNLMRRLKKVQKSHNAAIKELANLKRDKKSHNAAINELANLG